MNILIITSLLVILALIGILGVLWTAREVMRQMRAARSEEDISPERLAYRDRDDF
jgi:hypothetical protein